MIASERLSDSDTRSTSPLYETCFGRSYSARRIDPASRAASSATSRNCFIVVISALEFEIYDNWEQHYSAGLVRRETFERENRAHPQANARSDYGAAVKYPLRKRTRSPLLTFTST